MRISTALNHRDRFLGRLSAIYGTARRNGLSHAWILRSLSAHIYETPEWKRVPGWVTQSIRQSSQVHLDALYAPKLHPSELVQIAGGSLLPDAVPYLRNATRIDGVEYTTDEICEMAEASADADSRLAIWQSTESATVWNHKPEQAFSGWRKWRDSISRPCQV